MVCDRNITVWLDDVGYNYTLQSGVITKYGGAGGSSGGIEDTIHTENFPNLEATNYIIVDDEKDEILMTIPSHYKDTKG
jgi:hypothetical protein